MNNITLKQLRYFDAVAHHRHFGRAADACAISQPALSMQIKELEASLGAALFERDARQVRLTGLGEEFSERVRDILRSVEDLSDLARAAQEELVGRLRIGVIPTIAPYLLPSIMRSLEQAHAGLDIRMREALTPTLIDEVADGRLDTAVLALPISEASLEELPLFEEEFVLVRPAADAEKPMPDRKALREMRLLLLEEGHCFRDQALSFCDLDSAAPKNILEGNSLATLVQMVGAGIGVTLIPDMAVPLETRSTAVSVGRFAAPKPERTIGMIWRKKSPMVRQLQQVADVVRAAATKLAADGQA